MAPESAGVAQRLRQVKSPPPTSSTALPDQNIEYSSARWGSVIVGLAMLCMSMQPYNCTPTITVQDAYCCDSVTRRHWHQLGHAGKDQQSAWALSLNAWPVLACWILQTIRVTLQSLWKSCLILDPGRSAPSRLAGASLPQLQGNHVLLDCIRKSKPPCISITSQALRMF